jgi:hypothetical protein
MALPVANLGYSYDTLPGPHFIRLLTLHPAENITDSIKCSIETVDLIAEKDKYDALSYSWGMDDGSGDAFSLTLDDTPFSITQNLCDGLRRIRMYKEPVRIWIDALCINQNDDPEKSVQVAIMADVYAGAKTVHVWLGEGEDAAEDKLFLEVLKQMEERAATVGLWRDPHRDLQHCFILPLLGKGASRCLGCVAAQRDYHVSCGRDFFDHHTDRMSKWFASDPTEGHNAAKMMNLGVKFFSRRYWKRRWILQELAFAKKQVWYWGRCVMDVSNFPKDWLDNLSRAHDVIECALRSADRVLDKPGSNHSGFQFDSLGICSPIGDRLERISRFCTLQTHDNKYPLTWISCLKGFRTSECSDARDMYYALASMIEPRIRVDYSLTKDEVFVNFAKMMLGLGEWEWLFYCAGQRATAADLMQGDNIDTLPSWIPDPRLVNPHYGIQGDRLPMGIRILEGNALLCDVRCLGVLQESNHRTELQWDRQFWQICSLHRALDENQSIEEILRRPMQLAPLQPARTGYNEWHARGIRLGDIVCSCREEFSRGDPWLVLRPSKFASQTYKLVGAVSSSYSTGNGTVHVTKVHMQGYRTCPKIKVRII